MLKQFIDPKNKGFLELASQKGPNSGVFIILGVICLLVILLFVWAAYFRKRKRRSKTLLPKNISVAQSRLPGERRRKRKRRWKNRNPTLSQTGGLPATKTEDVSQS